MGVVYKAEDLKLGRHVALKFLPDELANHPQALERFRREARAASALNHSNICTIYEIDEVDGRAFIAMELLEGQTLRHLINGKPLEIETVLSLGIEIADALDAAHSAGIVHRDIKPANIFVTKRGHAKVLDFGLAKLSARQGAGAGRERHDHRRGVPTDHSGRHARHRRLHVTRASASQGTRWRAPISFPSARSCTRWQLGRCPSVGKARESSSKPFLTRTPTSVVRLNPDVPSELERIINKCLEKDRGLRYQHASDICSDLQRLKRDLDSGRVPEISNRASPLPLPKIFDSLAVLPLVNATGDPDTEYLSDGISESVINLLSQLPNLRVIPRTSAFRYKGHKTDLRTIGRDLNVRAVLTGMVTQRGDRFIVQAELVDVVNDAQLWGGKYNRNPEDFFELQEELARQISENLRLRLTQKRENPRQAVYAKPRGLQVFAEEQVPPQQMDTRRLAERNGIRETGD